MTALLNWLKSPFSGSVSLAQKMPEPEPVRPNRRQMTGFLATLTPEQRQAALAYRGEDGHGVHP